MKTIEKHFDKWRYYKIQPSKEGWSGRTFVKGEAGSIITCTKLEDLEQVLIDKILKSLPHYFGFDGAKARFLRVCKDGFRSANYQKERLEKAEAKAMLDKCAPLEKLMTTEVNGIDILRVIQHTELISPVEKARLGVVLKSNLANDFVRGAAAFAAGDVGTGLVRMKEALKAEKVATWPAVTYLPFLWRPHAHMFLKPEVTKEYARRVGHPFHFAYSSELTPAVYDQLLDLARQTEKHISDLRPDDRIDIQGFIWVVNRYDEPGRSQG